MDNSSSSSSSAPSSNWQPWPPEALTMARMALDLTRQDWSLTGQTTFCSIKNHHHHHQHNSNTNSSSSHHGTTSTTTTIQSSFGSHCHPTLSELGNKVGMEEIVERMVALLLIRVVALVTCRMGNYNHAAATAATSQHSQQHDSSKSKSSSGGGGGTKSKSSSKSGGGGGNNKQNNKIYSDYSTTTICKAALQLNNNEKQQKEEQHNEEEESDGDDDDVVVDPLSERSTEVTRNSSSMDDDNTNSNNSTNNSNPPPPPPPFPRAITPLIIAQLRHYVSIICRQYKPPDTIPYHNVEHAYHVFLSAHKLLDLLLCETPEDIMGGMMMGGGGGYRRGSSGGSSSSTLGRSGSGGSSSGKHHRNSRGRRRGSNDSGSSYKKKQQQQQQQRLQRPTFGIKSDPLSQLAFLFSALVHDVDHTGISNRQLVLEMDDLAILYNDQSVAEQRSLAVAFTTLKQERYTELRGLLFPHLPPPPPSSGGEAKNTAGGNTKPTTQPSTQPHNHHPGGVLGNEDFYKFRKLVIDLVLVTDIASPERTQIVKSKWKEAFGDVIVAEKMKKSVIVAEKLKKSVLLSSNNKGNNNSGSINKGSMVGGGGAVNSGSDTFVGRRGRGGDSGSVDNGGARGRVRTGGYEPVNNSSSSVSDKAVAGGAGDSNNGSTAPGGGGGGDTSKLVPTRRKSRRKSSGSLGDSGSKGALAPASSAAAATRSTSHSSSRSNSSHSHHHHQQRPIFHRNASQSSFVSEIDESMRDSLLEYDSIDFSDSDSSSSLNSDLQSLEDEFNASAVSRSKMNFNNCFNGSSNSNNNSSTSVSDPSSEGNNNHRDGGGKTLSSSSRRGRRHDATSPAKNHRSRWSTGDLAGDLEEEEDEDKQEQEQPTQMFRRQDTPSDTTTPSPSSPSSGQNSSRRRATVTANKSTKPPSFEQNPAFNPTPITMNKRKTSTARVQRVLSQSMLTHREMVRRPRAHSEERRLGVRRALDLAGSTIIAYSGSLRGSTSSNEHNFSGDGTPGGGKDGEDGMNEILDPEDDEDEFKATVVLEQMIRAADVAALLQDWENFMKWSTRLYRELKNGFLQHRGEDPSVEWYENQIKFLDFYILPLAKNLGVMGVFEENVGGMFAYCVKRNLAQWDEEGGRATELMMKEDEDERKRQWEEQFQQQLQDSYHSDGIDSSIRSVEPELYNQSLGGPSSSKHIDGIDSPMRSMGSERYTRGSIGVGQQESLTSSFKSAGSQSDGIDTSIRSLGSELYNRGSIGGGQHESLTSSFKSVSSVKSCSSATTAMASNNNLRASFRRKRSGRRGSMEAGEGCVVCGVVGRFSCPVCGAPYCSAKCCRDHKASGCSK